MPQNLYIIGALVAVVALILWAALRKAKREGAAQATADIVQKQSAEAEEKADSGRVAVAEAKIDLRKGKTPAQIKAANDNAWKKK